ncbi:efflux RND transporter periplasmic adaptor subunit [Delftia acidovorans]|uniref:Efflux RND transporter periplasmic adaptor subunit n=1 Tax=Delftia acidovorans TaxID=80866 RepID=A0A7T2RZA7_DELAC|nr:efflux RND transporter periplasmic adaptor subunit [Delftia acidovorans]QPS06106.1 efflux RND transporter periplasmic adaptor subunit [Delftia acidovorans]
MNTKPSSSSLGPRRTLVAIAVILALGALAATLILRSGTPGAAKADSHGHGHSEAAGHADGEHHGAAAEDGHKHDEGHADDEHHEDSKAEKAEAKPAAQPAAKPAAEAGHGDDEGLIAMDAQRMQAAGVRLAEAGPATVRSVLQLPGEIRFNEDRTAHVVPRVAGIAESVPANLGQNVKKGQLLAVLSSAAVSEQRSELLAASKRLELARTTYAREKQLWEEKVSAEQDYLQARQALREAEIAVSNAQQKLAATGAGAGGAGGLNRFELRAPFDGVIVEKHLSVGEAVQDTTQVFTISDLRSVWAEMRVAAPDLPAVRVGEKATVRATAFDSSATGEVAYVGALIGQDTRTAPARITLPNPDGVWRPGLFVNVELTASSRQAPLAVATQALQKMEQQTVVFVPVQGGFRAQPVRVGRSDGKATEVLEGLKPGQSYVAEGSFMLKAELGKATAEHSH